MSACSAIAPPQRHTKSAAWALITSAVFFSDMNCAPPRNGPMPTAAGRAKSARAIADEGRRGASPQIDAVRNAGGWFSSEAVVERHRVACLGEKQPTLDEHASELRQGGD